MRLVLLPALLCLAACAGAQAPTASVCRPELAASLPLRVESAAVVTQVTINDQLTDMMIDTGASTVMVTKDAKARLHLTDDPHGTSVVHGVGGTTAQRANALIRRLGFGGLDTDDVSASVGELGPHKFSTFVAGLIGTDYLSFYDLEFDMPAQRLNLYRMSGCDEAFRPSDSVGDGTPLLESTTHMMLTELHVQNQRLVALVDTGSANTVMTLPAAHRLGVSDAALAADAGGHGSGADGNPVTTHSHLFTDIDIAGQHLPEARFVVGGFRIGSDLLLGVDWLRTRRVWVSYSAGRLFLLKPDASGAGATTSPL
jgi:predicted aspartyl protease